MNILFLTRRFHPQIGGVETHVLEIGKRLVGMGHNVTVIAELDLNSKYLKSDELEKIKIIRIKRGRENWFRKFIIWFEIFKRLSLIKNADIIHCHDVFFWYLPFRFIFPLKKVYVTFHGYEGVCPPAAGSIFIRKISEKLAYGNICVGDYISKWYGTKPDYTIYGGIDVTGNYKDNYSYKGEKKLRILLAGRLEEDIGVSIYAKALHLLKTKKIKFEFRAFGEGKLEHKLKKYGRVSGFTNDISRKIRKGDIVFASSYLLILQSLLARKRVIAVYENPLKEDYLKMSPFVNFIYICRSASEVESVIGEIQNEPWKSESMINNGYKWARSQTWEKLVKVYLRLWKML